MALIELTYAVRVGFSGAYQCLLSDSNESITGISNYEITTPSGAAPPPAPAADVINVEESFANEVPVPEGVNIDSLDLAQVFSCIESSLEAGIGSATYFSSYSAVNLLPISQVIPKIKIGPSIKLDTSFFGYSTAPKLEEIALSAKVKTKVIKYYITAESGSFTLSPQNISMQILRTAQLDVGSFTLSSVDTAFRQSIYKLKAAFSNITLTDPGNPNDPNVYVTYSSDFSTGTGLTSNILQSKNGYDEFSISYYSAGSYAFDTMGITDPPEGQTSDYVLNCYTYNERERINIGNTQANVITSSGLKNLRQPNHNFGIECRMKFRTRTFESTLRDQVALVAYEDPDAYPHYHWRDENPYWQDDVDAVTDRYPLLMLVNNQFCLSGTAVDLSGNDFILSPDWYHPTQIQANTWYHVVVESHNGYLNVAVDGVWGTPEVPAPVTQWNIMYVGTSQYTASQNYKQNFYGEFYDVNIYFGSRYRHQPFTVPTQRLVDRFGYLEDSWTPDASKFTKKIYASFDAGVLTLTGMTLDTNAVYGGNASTSHTTILDGGTSAANAYPELEYINFLTDKVFTPYTGSFSLIGKADLSSLVDELAYPATSLHILERNSSIVDASAYANNITLQGQQAPIISSTTLYTGNKSVKFRNETAGVLSWLEIDPITWSANYNGVYTIDFWLRLETLDRVGEILSIVNTDHVFDELYTSANGENQWSLRFQAKDPEALGISVINPWSDSDTQYTGLAWCELPYVEGGIINYTNNTFHTSPTATNGKWLPNTNTWYHVSIVRDGSSNVQHDLLYINGSLYGYAYRPELLDITNKKLVIGRGLNGYIQDFRILKGARYRTANFAPDTFKLPIVGNGDPYYSKTAALASWNNLKELDVLYGVPEATNLMPNFHAGYKDRNVWYLSSSTASTPIPDFVSHPSITYANSSLFMLTAAAPSIAVDQIGPSVERAHPRDRDFCIEGWMYYYDLPTSYTDPERSTRVCFFACGTTGTGATHATETFINAGYDPVAGNASLRYGTGTYTSLTEVTAAYTLNVDTWYHVAVIRNGTSLQLCIDGSVAVSATIGALSFPDTTATAYPIVWQVGRWFYDSMSESQPVGYLYESTVMNLHEVRYTIDTPRYTAPFTVPDQTFIVGPGSASQI